METTRKSTTKGESNTRLQAIGDRRKECIDNCEGGGGSEGKDHDFLDIECLLGDDNGDDGNH